MQIATAILLFGEENYLSLKLQEYNIGLMHTLLNKMGFYIYSYRSDDRTGHLQKHSVKNYWVLWNM